MRLNRRIRHRVARRLAPELWARAAQPTHQEEAARSRPDEAADKRQAAARANATAWGYAYRGLLAGVTGVRPAALGNAAMRAPTKERDQENRSAAAAVHGKSLLADALLHGLPLEDAVVESTHALLASGHHVVARSIAQSLQDREGTRVAGALGSGLVALRMQLVELAWDSFRRVPAETWERLVPAQYVRAALLNGDPDVAGHVLDMVARRLDLDAAAWLAIAEALLGGGHRDVARAVGQLVRDQVASGGDVDEETREGWLWLEGWLDRPVAATDVTVGAEELVLGVLDYKQPDRRHASTNLGDYVQTLAAMGHLLRHRNLEIAGDTGVAEVARELHGHVRPELHADTPRRRVRLVGVNRDASNNDVLPEDTWLIAFGWYMHDQFGLRTDFPFHPNIRPLFVSFHCNRRRMLTPEAISYLRHHAPVGCRDWYTVDLLLSVGVPAFFSGCLTTTVGTLFPETPSAPARPEATVFVDVPAPAGAETLTQASPDVRRASLAENLRAAVALLERYRTEFGSVVTSRLHCFLPAWAVGANVDFQPGNRADVRFNGLLDADEPERIAMRDRILELLLPVTTALMEGADVDEVRDVWQRVTAPEVERAVARHRTVGSLPPPSFGISHACAQIRHLQVDVPAAAPRVGREVNVALALDGNLKEELDVVVTSMVRHTARPLHLWVLSRDHGPEDFQRFAATHPEVTASWLPCDAVDYGPVLGMLRHITVSTMDRLLLPDLLPELDRILYHDVDALPLADVGEIFDVDLHGSPLAARSSVARHVSSGYETVHLAARRLRDRPSAANDLLHRMYARQPYDFPAFNAGILVLDLRRMREEGFGRHFIPFVEQYGMNDQEVLNCYAGSRRTELPEGWNALPTQEPVTEPKIVHWAGPLKPWLPRYVAYQDRWLEQAEVARQRRSRAGLDAGGAATRGAS